MARYVVEGTWSGYTSAQSRVVHRAVVSKKTAEQIRELGSIRYTDGTRLNLDVREAKPRERVEVIDGYGRLIDDCLALGVSDVAELEAARQRKRVEFDLRYRTECRCHGEPRPKHHPKGCEPCELAIAHALGCSECRRNSDYRIYDDMRRAATGGVVERCAGERINAGEPVTTGADGRVYREPTVHACGDPNCIVPHPPAGKRPPR